MSQPADFHLVRRGSGAVLALTGDWTSLGIGHAGARLAAALRDVTPKGVDLAGLGLFDTAGAYELARVAKLRPGAPGLEARPDAARLMELVGEAIRPPRAPAPKHNLTAILARIGLGVEHFLHDLVGTFAFYGRLVATVGNLAVNPRRIRLAPVVSLMERAGIDALPIIGTTNFFVGATIAFLGANLLSQFGASVFSVELIGVGVLREFAVLITAVILAGRSASSFAAELGAMKMNQEIDAMQVMGVDPFEALILPRFIAMLIMMPLLVFVAMVTGIVGGMLVIWAVLNLSPAFFVDRLLTNVGVTHFWAGIVKAPVLAIVIAAIGCRQGFEVGGDVEQLGRRVTSAVVQALFAIIILDAVFALLFMELDI
ncbi:MAG TPA: ABC transporter permease [Caulobacteraceae bacterium]|nr:ABC transporter permease [Caulobacteraceae bacterium]